jgi:hypothetical protein
VQVTITTKQERDDAIAIEAMINHYGPAAFFQLIEDVLRQKAARSSAQHDQDKTAHWQELAKHIAGLVAWPARGGQSGASESGVARMKHSTTK